MSTPTTVMVFDGQNSLVVLPQLPPMAAGVTIEFWALGDAGLPRDTSVFASSRADGTRVLNIHLPWSDSRVTWDASSDGGGLQKAAAPEEYKGSWTHWAFVKDVARGEMAIYRGGALWHRGIGNSRPVSDSAQAHIGAYANGNHKWCGRLAEFRIWDRARSQTEVRVGLGRRLTGTEPGLVGYWPLNEVRPDGTTPDLAGRRPGLARGVTLTADDGFTLAPTGAGLDYESIEPISPRHLMGWKSTTSGLEDYAMWRQTLKDERLEGDPSFRRGCIWA